MLSCNCWCRPFGSTVVEEAYVTNENAPDVAMMTTVGTTEFGTTFHLQRLRGNHVCIHRTHNLSLGTVGTYIGDNRNKIIGRSWHIINASSLKVDDVVVSTGNLLCNCWRVWDLCCHSPRQLRAEPSGWRCSTLTVSSRIY